MSSVFRTPDFEKMAYPYRWEGTLHLATIAGGRATDEKVVEGHVKTKLVDDRNKDELIREAVAEAMLDRGVTEEVAAEIIGKEKYFNGFNRDSNGLWIGGFQLKACLKESANIAANAGKLAADKWGNPTNANYKKGIKAWFPEHNFIVEDRLYFGMNEPSGVNQHFPKSRYGSSLQYVEYIADAKLDFTFISDHDWKEKDLAMLWLTAERDGLGAMRSQGYGQFEVERFDRIS